MKVDVYKQDRKQDPNTGAIKRDWDFYKTINCSVQIISEVGASVSANNKELSDKYEEVAKMRIKTPIQLTKRDRVVNFRNRSGENVFNENEKIDSPATIFEVESSSPIIDPLGSIICYEATVQRVGVQSFGG